MLTAMSGVDLGERAQELGPVLDVVPDADGDELPGRVLRPGVDTRSRSRWAPCSRASAGTRVNEVSSTPRMSAAGQIVASLAAAWNTSGPSQRMQATMSMPCHIRCEGSISAPMFVAPTRSTSLLQGDRGEHQVVRVHLDGHPDVVLPGQRVDLGPELVGHVPLVVQHVHVDPVPGVDDPGRVLGVRVGAGGAGHGDTCLHPEQPGQLDGAAQVVGVFGADAG